MRVAVIPARGGSKRIPRKNIKDFCGKPMIAWSIDAAIKSNCFDAVIVSTDDEEVAVIAKSAGAQVPFVRPAALSDDYAGTVPVIRHAVEWLLNAGKDPKQVCCVYATAPFVSAIDILNGLSVLEATGADYAFTVTSYAFPIQRAIRLIPGGRLEMFQPEQFTTRSQDLEEAYHDAGQFYWGNAGAWLEGKALFGPHAAPIILPRYRVQDIDTEEDWIRAELLHKVMSMRECE